MLFFHPECENVPLTLWEGFYLIWGVLNEQKVPENNAGDSIHISENVIADIFIGH